MNRPLTWSIAALLAALPACGGEREGVGCDPVTIVPGTWCVTVTGSNNTCARPVPPPFAAQLAQGANALVATSAGATYTGSLCGNTGTLSGSDPALTVSVAATFASAAFASGVSSWSGGGCSGTDTFTATASPCP